MGNLAGVVGGMPVVGSAVVGSAAGDSAVAARPREVVVGEPPVVGSAAGGLAAGGSAAGGLGVEERAPQRRRTPSERRNHRAERSSHHCLRRDRSKTCTRTLSGTPALDSPVNQAKSAMSQIS